jgi:glycosyltransferase involved in cell wall biosynthesis
MKFLMVTHYFDSHQGGIEIVAGKLFRGLLQRQCEVVWAAANVSAAPIDEALGSALALNTWNGVEKIAGLPFPVPGIGALKDIYSQVGRADIVLLHDCLYLSNIAAFLCALHQRVPVMIVQHIGVVPYRNFLLKSIMKFANALITRPMLASAQQVVFISQITARYFASVNFRKPPVIVFNGVDTQIYRPLQKDESQKTIRDSLGLPREGKVALFVGRFVEKKGIPIMERLVGMRPDWTWAFAGTGPLDPSGWKAPNVQVFSSLRGESMALLYRACDLLVLPSVGEGFPLVVQEALASGLPVVCGAETLEADPEIGRFVRGTPMYADDDVRTARECLTAIEDVLEAGAGSENVSKERHAFASAHYSWQHATERYIELALHLIPAKSDPTAVVGAGT